MVTAPAAIPVSIIVPAYNAAETIDETLESLVRQSHAAWEAVIVDDGSTDETAARARAWVEREPRMRLVQVPHGGVGRARNAGLAAAAHPWLVFLDADDWLQPDHLERMTRPLADDPTVDATHCAWVRISPQGQPGEVYGLWPVPSIFQAFATACYFSIHSCLVRAALVNAVGGFDPELRTCEDWDLWQRIARTGARFAHVEGVTARCRMRPRSASVDGGQMLADGLKVLERGHGPDPRVKQPRADYAAGLSPEGLPEMQVQFLAWTAGLVLGSGGDAAPLLRILGEVRAPGVDAAEIARSLFDAAVLPGCQTAEHWGRLWGAIGPRVAAFLEALEASTRAPALAAWTQRALERLIASRAPCREPLVVGLTQGVRVDVTQPLTALSGPAGVERLVAQVFLGDRRLGEVELPYCDGRVTAPVLADAVSAEFAWPILAEFLAQTVYPQLRVEPTAQGAVVWRGAVRIGDVATSPDAPEFWRAAHEQIGWTVMLQELWGEPDKPGGWFYDAAASDDAEAEIWPAGPEGLRVEISQPLAAVSGGEELVPVLAEIGGAATGVLMVPTDAGRLSTAQLREQINTGLGYELCRLTVREAVLGRPLAAEPVSVRARLRAASAAPRAAWPEQAADVLVLSRWSPAADLGALGHRAALPAASAEDLRRLASRRGGTTEPGQSQLVRAVFYAPELIEGLHAEAPRAVPHAGAPAAPAAEPSSPRRRRFEQLFARQPDPWGYTSEYEQVKYEQTLSVLPRRRWRRALELACAEGHFTRQLAPLAQELVAADISGIALERAAARCRDLPRVVFRRLEIGRDALPGRFDFIVCSEVLYYLEHARRLPFVADQLAAHLRLGGYLVTAHAHVLADEPDRPGFNWDVPFGIKSIQAAFMRCPALTLTTELRAPLYSILVFRKRSRLAQRLLPARHRPRVIETERMGALRAEAAAGVRWHGGRPVKVAAEPSATAALPILMYHRIDASGGRATRQYRVDPEQFERQLAYLKEAGFRSVGLPEWLAAHHLRRPLPGNAVLLTFDDGYRDFLTAAWPLLKRYGFSAVLYLVADAVGGTNHWDRAYGESVPLLGWDELAALQREGVVFGAHSLTHRPLAALSPIEIVREAARSRALLEERLRGPIETFSYPYGATDGVVRHLIGACGYTSAVTCVTDRARFRHSALAFPRLEVRGDATFEEFVRLVSGS